VFKLGIGMILGYPTTSDMSLGLKGQRSRSLGHKMPKKHIEGDRSAGVGWVMHSRVPTSSCIYSHRPSYSCLTSLSQFHLSAITTRPNGGCEAWTFLCMHLQFSVSVFLFILWRLFALQDNCALFGRMQGENCLRGWGSTLPIIFPTLPVHLCNCTLGVGMKPLSCNFKW